MRGISRFGVVRLAGAVGALWACAACGNVTDTSPDAAAPDARPDGPPPPTIHQWVIDKQTLPATTPETVTYGLDLNGDLVVDNQLGAAFAVFSGQGLGLQPAVDAAIARGSILMLCEAALGVDSPTGATFTV